MPARFDIDDPPDDALERLMMLGALDIEQVGQTIAAILPDGVTGKQVSAALAGAGVRVSEAIGRDDSSIWRLAGRAFRVGPLWIAPPESDGGSNTLRIIDAEAFGSGHHPTTALCVEALAEMLRVEPADSLLDVGTGTAILALAALRLGVPQAVGVDIDRAALLLAARNAQLNGLEDRLQLISGGPEAADGRWPLVVANVLAAPLMAMAPALVRRLRGGGWLILSGIAESLEVEVRHAYEHWGMQAMSCERRAGWSRIILRATW